MRPKPKIVYVVTEDWYFLSHRLPMATAALRAGFDVHVATHVVDGGEEIESYGFKLHPLRWRRGSANALDLVRIIAEIRALYRVLRPNLVHHVGLQPTIIGALAGAGLGVKQLHALAGLGFAFTSRSLRARLAGGTMRLLIRTLLNRCGNTVLVQNRDDRAMVLALGMAADCVATIPGSGVDTDFLVPLPEPAGPITIAYVGRLLADKGLASLIAAYDLLMQRGRPVRLIIAGQADPANPTSFSPAEVDAWKARPNVKLLGQVKDIRQVWAAAHIAVLPSRREGLPMSLLEAAACGRPIVATDVPGCREIARANENALLVPPDDPQALAGAIDRLTGDAALRRAYGAAGRRMVEGEFSAAHVGREIAALYTRLIGQE